MMEDKLLLIAHDLEQLAIWHNPYYGMEDIENEMLNYASMLKTTAGELSKPPLEKHLDKLKQIAP